MNYTFLFLLTLCVSLLHAQPFTKEMDAVGDYKIPEGINYAGIASYSADMFIISLPAQTISASKVKEGTIVTFTATSTNMGPSKLMVTNGKKSTSAFPIYKNKREELEVMDISAGRLIMAIFNADHFHLLIKNEEIKQFLVNCNNVWVSTLSNQNFCGDCNTKCAPSETCLNGECVERCPSNSALCNANCVDLRLDPNNCGDCGVICPSGTVCNNGKCDSNCPKSLEKCANTCADLETDENNCGTCGNSCPPGFICDRGACKIDCPSDLTNCNFDCVELSEDPYNCGACGLKCPKGYTCKEGNCLPLCPPGALLCNGVCINIAKDAMHCGECGRNCPPGQICLDGKCQ